MKTCACCGRRLWVDDFYRFDSTGRRIERQCKDCQRSAARARVKPKRGEGTWGRDYDTALRERVQTASGYELSLLRLRLREGSWERVGDRLNVTKRTVERWVGGHVTPSKQILDTLRRDYADG